MNMGIVYVPVEIVDVTVAKTISEIVGMLFPLMAIIMAFALVFQSNGAVNCNHQTTKSLLHFYSTVIVTVI